MESSHGRLSGSFLGRICESFPDRDRIPNAQIVALRADGNAPPLPESLDRSKIKEIDEATFKRVLQKKHVQAETDDDGSFCLRPDDYQGAPVDLYARIDRVATPTLESATAELDAPQFLHLGAYTPEKIAQDTWLLPIELPASLWCAIRRKADMWVIAGRVVAEDAPSFGLEGVIVTAFDVDLIEHDNLGTATTGPGGLFRIDYPGARFRQGTWIDVELFGGPDVYFHVEDAGGTELLDESPAKGRRSDRRDREPCFFLRLPVPVPVPPPVDNGTQVIPTVWTGVGDTFLVPDAARLNNFDAEGYAYRELDPRPAGARNYALYGTVDLTGSAPVRSSGGFPVEYRFLISETPGTNGGSAPPAGSFNRIVGGPNDNDLFARTKVGQMVRYSPYRTIDIEITLDDVAGGDDGTVPDAEQGWVDVNNAIRRAFTDTPDVSLADLSDFVWYDKDPLVVLNTTPLTRFNDFEVPGDPGDEVSPSERVGIQKVAIRFEIREVRSPGDTPALPGSGTTLNAAVIDNTPPVFRFEMADQSGCDPFGATLGAGFAYSVYHPHLGAASIRVASGDPGAPEYDATLDLLSDNTALDTEIHNSRIAVPGTDDDGSALFKCTYTGTLRVTLRQHDGDDARPVLRRTRPFYYDPST